MILAHKANALDEVARATAGVVVIVPDTGGYVGCERVTLVLDGVWNGRPCVLASGLVAVGRPVTVPQLLAWICERDGSPPATSLFRKRGYANYHRAEFHDAE